MSLAVRHQIPKCEILVHLPCPKFLHFRDVEEVIKLELRDYIPRSATAHKERQSKTRSLHFLRITRNERHTVSAKW
jgi:hypothetical protein